MKTRSGSKRKATTNARTRTAAKSKKSPSRRSKARASGSKKAKRKSTRKTAKKSTPRGKEATRKTSKKKQSTARKKTQRSNRTKAQARKKSVKKTVKKSASRTTSAKKTSAKRKTAKKRTAKKAAAPKKTRNAAAKKASARTTSGSKAVKAAQDPKTTKTTPGSKAVKAAPDPKATKTTPGSKAAKTAQDPKAAKKGATKTAAPSSTSLARDARTTKTAAAGTGPASAPRDSGAAARKGAETPKPRKGAAAALVRADFDKPPASKPLDPSLEGEKYRSELRGPLRESGLPRRLAHGAVLPVLLSDNRSRQLREQLDWALEERVPAYYLAESFLQSYLFIGFPRTINALNVLHEVNRSRRRSLGLAADQLNVPAEIPSLDRILGGPSDFGSSLKGRRIRLAEGPPMHLEAPGEGPGSFERYAREWWRRGNELCRAIYSDQFHRLRENLGQVHPELADWMIFEGYGKVLSRPVITPKERELWIIPLLMAQDVPDQLYSHIRGALNLEIPSSRIRAVLWLGAAILGPSAHGTVSAMLEDIEKRPNKKATFFVRG